MKNGERPIGGLERAETDPARILARALEPDVTTPGPPWTHTFATGKDLEDPELRAPEPVRGYFVDEIYTEDYEEAIRIEDAAARRSAKMLGLLLIGAMLLVLGIGAWILWRATFG